MRRRYMRQIRRRIHDKEPPSLPKGGYMRHMRRRIHASNEEEDTCVI